MKTLVKEIIELPFEVGQTYQTRFATGESFTISKITPSKFWGIYETKPELGDCPLNPDRLIPRSQPTGKEIEMIKCPHCKKTFNDEG